jgi:hypothetical protein
MYTGKPNSFRDSLYYGVPEPNLQYLQGMPIYMWTLPSVLGWSKWLFWSGFQAKMLFDLINLIAFVIFLGGKLLPARRADNLTANCDKMWEPRHLTTL